MPADTCSRCGQATRTVITVGGKVRDLDPEPVATGNHVLVEDDRGYGLDGVGPAIRARVLTGDSGPVEGDRYRMHACPPRPPSGPRCRSCKDLMDASLTAAEGWETHPCCDPDYRADLRALRGRKMSSTK